MNIVLHEPEIPHNTGAIGRTCAITGTSLHLIRPLGFSIDEKHIRRTGLDYWHSLDVTCHDDYGSFCEYVRQNFPKSKVYMATTKAPRLYTEPSYDRGDFFMFGKESAGIPEEILLNNRDLCIRIPMLENSRSLNLSVSAGIVLYEALRQNGFSGLSFEGRLHRNSW